MSLHRNSVTKSSVFGTPPRSGASRTRHGLQRAGDASMDPAHADAAAPGCVLATSCRTRGSSETSESAPSAAGPLPAATAASCVVQWDRRTRRLRTQGAPARIRAGMQWQTAPHSIPMRRSEGNEARCELPGHAKPAQRALAERDLLPCRGRASIRSREAPTASDRLPRPFSGRVARRPRRARRYRVCIARSDVFRLYSCSAVQLFRGPT